MENKENPENNGLCEEIASLIDEKTRDGTRFFTCSPYVIRVKVEEGEDVDFIVGLIDLKKGLWLHPKNPIRFQKPVGQNWQVSMLYTVSRSLYGGSGDEWVEIPKGQASDDLSQLLETVKNCQPLKL